ncbi:MAG: hypothetical protein CM15mP58_16710 [Burkholderiaceae bacterium]|nr:MAG: hypothetical protein CM15mP58_16710 [Burkholderiaceae bacterium]
MKRLVLFIAFSFLLSSCASNYGKESGKKERSLKEKDGVTVSCKPQREIFVKGKCIKRRKYM